MIVLVPVPEMVKGVAPPRTRVPVCAPRASVSVDVFTALPLTVVALPFTVTVPEAKENVLFAILPVLTPILEFRVRFPDRVKLVMLEVTVVVRV